VAVALEAGALVAGALVVGTLEAEVLLAEALVAEVLVAEALVAEVLVGAEVLGAIKVVTVVLVTAEMAKTAMVTVVEGEEMVALMEDFYNLGYKEAILAMKQLELALRAMESLVIANWWRAALNLVELVVVVSVVVGEAEEVKAVEV
jgi:hypothetical protein